MTSEGQKRYNKYKSEIDENNRQLTKNLALSKYLKYDPDPRLAAYGVKDDVDKKAEKFKQSGAKLVEKMQKEGLISKDITYRDFFKQYKSDIDSGYNYYLKAMNYENSDKNYAWYMYVMTNDSTKKSK